MVKKFFSLFGFLFLVFIGTLFTDQVLKPYLIKLKILPPPSLSRPIYLQQIKEVKIKENQALKEAIELVEQSIFLIQTETKKGKIIEGSGIILSTDGLAITLAEIIPPDGKTSVFLNNGERANFLILKRNQKENLALLKIEKEKLSTAAFGDLEKLKIGERVFLIKAFSQKTLLQKKVNEGIVKYFNEEKIETNILEKENVLGSGLFDIEGKLLGINFLEKEQVFSIPISKIRAFSGL